VSKTEPASRKVQKGRPPPAPGKGLVRSKLPYNWKWGAWRLSGQQSEGLPQSGNTRPASIGGACRRERVRGGRRFRPGRHGLAVVFAGFFEARRWRNTGGGCGEKKRKGPVRALSLDSVIASGRSSPGADRGAGTGQLAGSRSSRGAAAGISPVSTGSRWSSALRYAPIC